MGVALQMDGNVATFCRLCEVMCGLTATVEGGRVVKIRGDTEHPVSAGFACNKGLLALDVHHDPERLDTPLRRTDSGWEPLSWTDALSDIAARLQAIIAKHGPNSVALYLGNPNAFNCTAGPTAVMFLLGLGSDKLFAAGTQDCSNKFAISEILYGSAGIHPTPDLARTDFVLLIGTNPRVSKSSFVSVPDPVAALRDVVTRGGKVTFVNPVVIEPDLGPTLQIKPDTDAYLLAAMLHVIDRTTGFDAQAINDHTTNIAALREFTADYSPARVAPIVGLDEATITDLAMQFAAAPSAAIHVSTGVNMGRQGALGYYLQQMLSLVTGNLDRAGGNVVPARATPPRPNLAGTTRDAMEATPFGPVRRSNSMLPASLLADWIRSTETPIKALINLAGNPALSLTDSDSIADAFGSLELLISIDLYRNATGEMAHFNLPAADWFERADLNTFTQGVQAMPHIQWTPAIVEPKGDRLPEWQIFSMLSEAMGQTPLVPLDGDAISMLNDGELASVGLSTAELMTRDRGLAVLQGDMAGIFFDAQIMTPDRRIDCGSELIVDSFARAGEIFAELAARPADQLILISRRTRNTLNSAFQNVQKLKDRGADTNPLYINPDDGEALGLAVGASAVMASDSGHVRVEIAYDPTMRRGVVAMTHGFGNADTSGMSTAQRYPGVNVNTVTPSGPGTFDPLSGMAHLTGIPVTVAAVS
jgi:anaerobic selenocysteine-containing dehydrogenase